MARAFRWPGRRGPPSLAAAAFLRRPANLGQAACADCALIDARSTRAPTPIDDDKLVANLRALIEALNKSKPASSKGIYLRKVAVSSTMGVGARVDIASINAQAVQAA